jgi:hypothetical protein
MYARVGKISLFDFIVGSLFVLLTSSSLLGRHLGTWPTVKAETLYRYSLDPSFELMTNIRADRVKLIEAI